MARIVVARRLPEAALERLREGAEEVWLPPEDRALSAEELADAVAGADALVATVVDKVDDALLEAAGPGLRCVANVGVGYDNIDVRGRRPPRGRGDQHAGRADRRHRRPRLALILMVTRRLGEGERRIRAGPPWAWDMFFLLGTGLQGKTLGVVGLGDIGRATARRARAFGMRIAYSQRSDAPSAVEAELEAERLALDELLERADVVSLHCPLTPATRHLVDAAALGRMGSGAYLVNTARGPIVDEAALAVALREERIAGAALDVFEREPEVEAELLGLERAVLVPHLGSATVETRTAMADLAARNALAVLAGEPPLNPVSAD